MSSIAYRGSIDGMRSIAVLGVLLFHLDKRWLPGGFVGVDVFFVISGYLITSIIRSDCQAGRFSLGGFYQRRVSRIFPVLFAVTIATVAAALLIYNSRDVSAVGELAIASVCSIANVKLMTQGDYFEVSPDSQPFLHYWSLSVEEQFYLVFPPLMLLAHQRGLSRRWLLTILALAAAASFIGCQALMTSQPVWAFYLLPTRAWELLAGALLAVAAEADNKRQSTGWLKVLGLLLVGGSLVLVNETRPFPSYQAAFPVVGTVLLIGRSHDPTQLTERILSHPWLVWIGRLSYSLYLWHWPIYCFVDYALYSEPAGTRIALKTLLTLTFSLASYFLIEGPMRSYLNAPRRRSVAFCGLAAGVILFSALGLWTRNGNFVNSPPAAVASGGVVFTAGAAAPSVVLMGDSHGSTYGTMVKQLSQQQQFNLNVLSSAGGNPLPGSALYEDTLAFLAKKKPDVTIFVAEWAAKLNDDNKDKLALAIDEVLKHSGGVVLITQPPALPYDTSRRLIRQNGVQPIFEDPALASRRQSMNAFIRTFQADRVQVIDVDPLFITSAGEMKFCDRRGRQLYQDRKHLSGHGADLVKQPLAEKLRELLPR